MDWPCQDCHGLPHDNGSALHVLEMLHELCKGPYVSPGSPMSGMAKIAHIPHAPDTSCHVPRAWCLMHCASCIA